MSEIVLSEIFDRMYFLPFMFKFLLFVLNLLSEILMSEI